MLGRYKAEVSRVAEPVARAMVGLRLRPNQLSCLGLAASMMAAVAFAADLLGARIGLGQQHGDVAIGLGADFLALLAALGAEFGRLALPLGLHALIDRLAVLLG